MKTLKQLVNEYEKYNLALGRINNSELLSLPEEEYFRQRDTIDFMVSRMNILKETIFHKTLQEYGSDFRTLRKTPS
ncbi:hypothetical protein [Vibrio phage RYC]|nr:hypothetical protein [Vibrio phage RYC]